MTLEMDDKLVQYGASGMRLAYFKPIVVTSRQSYSVRIHILLLMVKKPVNSMLFLATA